MPSARPPEGLPVWGGRYAQRLTVMTLATKGRICHLCRRPGADTADHIVPRSKRGSDSLDNLVPAHHACNSARGDMPLTEWFATHPVPHRVTLAASRDW